MYATRQDMIDAYGSDALTIAADRDGDGVEDAGVVDAALAAASAEMDSYIGAKYTLPLGTAPVALQNKCIDIAMFILSQRPGAMTEEIKERNKSALAWLRDVSRGLVSLGVEQSPQMSAGGVETSGADKVFTHKKMSGVF